MMKVVIPAAGFGTRFLPQTKAMPKEMLPIVDKPVIQYVVEEVVESGIQDIVIVTWYSKRSIEDHFDMPTKDLEENLILWNKDKYLEQIRNIGIMANFIYTRQKWWYGNGVPVLSAEPIIGHESFAVLRWDEFIQWTPPRLQQMLSVHQKFPDAIIISGVRIHDRNILHRYGIGDITLIQDNIYNINHIVEKPNADEAPSNLMTGWAYILPPSIFDALRQVWVGKWWEVWLVDAINLLKAKWTPVYAVEIQDGIYYDTGNKLEYMKTVTQFALKHPEIWAEYTVFLQNMMNA